MATVREYAPPPTGAVSWTLGGPGDPSFVDDRAGERGQRLHLHMHCHRRTGWLLSAKASSPR